MNKQCLKLYVAYFYAFPLTAQLHFTSDDLAHFNKTDADCHARSQAIVDKTIRTVDREDLSRALYELHAENKIEDLKEALGDHYVDYDQPAGDTPEAEPTPEPEAPAAPALEPVITPEPAAAPAPAVVPEPASAPKPARTGGRRTAQ